MISTPNKDLNSSNSQLTPVRLLESPKVSKETSSNCATCKTRLDLILKTLQDNYAKWQLAQKRGLALCYSIEAIKTRCLEALNKTTQDTQKTTPSLYPKELKPYCDKLCIISSIFLDISANAKESLKQIKALSKLNNITNEIFYRTWKLQQFNDFATELTNCYEEESKVKELVMKRLPHCLERAELVHLTTAWEYPQHVDAHIDLYFKFLNEEIKLDKR